MRQNGISRTASAQAAPLFVSFMATPVSLVAWAAQPSAETEFLGAATTRRAVDLTGKTTFKVQTITGTAGQAGAKIRIKYSLDNGSTWTTCEASGGTTGDANLAAGLNVGAAAPLATAAATTCLIAAFGVAGNGVTSPTFGLVAVTFT